MTAEELLNGAAQVGYVLIFLVVLAREGRRPTLANLLSAVFFGISALLVVGDWVSALIGEEVAAISAVQTALLLLWPYPLLRLAHEFTGVRTIALRLSEAGVVVSMVAVALTRGGEIEGLLAGVLVVYFVGTVGYASWRFVYAARGAHGVPRIRLRAAALGSAFVALLVLMAIPSGVDPDGPWSSVGVVCGLASGVAYFLAFAPPPWLRSAWAAPYLERFITESILNSPVDRVALPELAAVLEENVNRMTGAPRSALLVPDPDTGYLSSPSQQTERQMVSPGTTVAFRCFQEQRPVFDDDPATNDPANAEAYRALGAAAVLAVPITLQAERFGVLTVLADRPPFFAEADLQMLQILADQVAVILRDRDLLATAAETAAQREALRLKDDFLSAAAHDLKTPLTTLLAQSQLMQRFAMRDPEGPADREGIDRLVTEAQRMRRLVGDLLDASRAEQSGFVGARRPVDLFLMAQETVMAFGGRARRVAVEGESCVVSVDRDRIAQVLENLLDNALKYSPEGGTVRVAVHPSADGACIQVEDSGVGIPEADLPMIFERFQRGSSVDERRFSGLGLGLYLCKRIVEEHGGKISVTSSRGQGSTFTVQLPAALDGGDSVNV